MPAALEVLTFFAKKGVELQLHQEFAQILQGTGHPLPNCHLFSSPEELLPTDLLISLGGDGTLLQTVTYGAPSGIPILGVNAGRLGYLSTMQAADIAQGWANIIEGNYSRDSAKKSMTKLLRKEDNFDGVFAANDQMAMGAIDVLAENRIQVPEDVKVIGFDGIEQAASFNPPISTIAQPSYDLGARVASQLTLPRSETVQNIELALELIVRKSTAK
jgi:hypothetical protein